MDSKKYVDKITLKYLTGNKYSQVVESENRIEKDDVHFYKKRILNTTRELLKKNIDISFNEEKSSILENSTVKDSFNHYIKCLIYAYKQQDTIDFINNHNGFISNSNNNENITENNNKFKNVNITNIDISNIDSSLYNKSLVVKNKYDWSNFCKIEKNTSNKVSVTIPKIAEYNLKDPSLRMKGVKNKKSFDNIVEK